MTPAGYEILSELYRTDTQVAYQARQRATGQLVMLQMRLFHEERAGSHGFFDDQLHRAQEVALLDHPGILPVLAVGRYEFGIYLARPFLQGTTLYDQLRGAPVDQRQAARWALRLASAVRHAHDHGVFGCDLGSNFVLIEDGEPMLDTFDTAHVRFLHPPLPPEDPAALLGIPATMSPERVRGQGRPDDPRRDVLALGVLLYEMLTGSLILSAVPVLLVGETLHEAHISRPRTVRPSLDADLET